MRTFIVILFCTGGSIGLHAQSIVGKWQLVKETNCMSDTMTASESTQDLLNDMKSRSTTTPQIITFKEKQNGEESTRILNRKKGANTKGFHYKFDGEKLLILDKKSHTLTDSFQVEKFSSDSLIISNYARPCETKIFLRIK